MISEVMLVSLGTGGAGVITVDSMKALNNADLIIYPCNSKGKGKAWELLDALGVIEKSSGFTLPMKVDRSEAIEVYSEMSREAELAARSGKSVVIAVEGDAGIFASMHYVAELLCKNGITVRQLPGIPSFIAASAMAGLHLVSGDERLIIIPGNASCREIESYYNAGHNIVVMKASRSKSEILDFIKKYPSAEIHYYENVSTSDECHITDHQLIGSAAFPYFSLVIIIQPRS